MPTAARKCKCGCGAWERREDMHVTRLGAFINEGHERAYRTKPKKVKAAKPKKKKLKTIAKLRNDVAELLQKLVRMKATRSDDGTCFCVTCGKHFPWKEMHGGHFIERGKGATKLMVENVHPQCAGCNTFGMKRASVVLAYRRYMVDMYGEKFVQDLERLANTPVKHTRQELEALAFEFKRQIQYQEERLAGRAQQQEIAA